MIRGNHVVGSELIGQRFIGPQYFHGRPSATDPAYNASGSGASNFGPTNRKFIEQVSQRMDQVRKENGLHLAEPIPADLVLASASGLDPHITVESAMLQVPRVARARRLPGSRIENLVRQHSEEPLLGIWGKRRVNVLKLNVALDEIQR
jgi:K+-transporting ATPase ATPase C chain